MTGSGSISLDRQGTEHPANDPTLSMMTPHLVSSHRTLGFAVRFETNDPRIGAAAGAILGPQCDEIWDDPEITMRLLVHEVDEPPDWTPRQPIIREQLGLYSVAASRATFVHGDAKRGVLAGFISPTVAGMSEYLQSNIVQSAFLIAINRRVLGAVHTACITKDGRSLMLRGMPGAGKSTTAYVALRSGYSLVGEDVVFPRRLFEDARITLHGVPWMLYLMPDAVRFFPELHGVPVVERSNGERKIPICVHERFPSQCAEQASVGSSVFIARSIDGETRLTGLNDDEFLRSLMDTSIEFERRAARDNGLWDEVRRYPAYRLEIGPDPFDVVPILERLLEEK